MPFGRCLVQPCLLVARFLTVDPLSLHELVVVDSGSDAVIRLRGYDLDGDSVWCQFLFSLCTLSFLYVSQLSVSIDSLPSTGTLTQLSQVYSSHGFVLVHI